MQRFPELAAREMRAIDITGWTGLPDGTYGFMEFYCEEPGCDCRRVVIQVVRPETRWDKIWATINYGWESPEFYRRWIGGSLDVGDMHGAVLDPLNLQSQYSPALLKLFQHLLESPEYAQRLRTHYQLFRAAVEKRHGGAAARSRRGSKPKRRR